MPTFASAAMPRRHAPPLGQVLYESGDTLSPVCFPTTAVVPLLYVTQSGTAAEFAVVGNEDLDSLSGSDLVMTQALIANMLGVRRQRVTAAALKLQHAGLIRHSRGLITVLDRRRLEPRTRACYAVVKKAYDRLLPSREAG
jgi:CRP-like cAMP-binding protein